MGRYDQDSNITKEDFMAWERIRASGIVNPVDVYSVSELSGVPVEKCRYILRNYPDLHNKFMPKEQ